MVVLLVVGHHNVVVDHRGDVVVGHQVVAGHCIGLPLVIPLAPPFSLLPPKEPFVGGWSKKENEERKEREKHKKKEKEKQKKKEKEKEKQVKKKGKEMGKEDQKEGKEKQMKKEKEMG